MRETEQFEPILLAQWGLPNVGRQPAHQGTFFTMVNQDPNQYFFHTDEMAFDPFLLTIRYKVFYTIHFDRFLPTYQPDIVHFQHTLFLGFDLIRQVRTTLPDIPIVYTLHEYLPIC